MFLIQPNTKDILFIEIKAIHYKFTPPPPSISIFKEYNYSRNSNPTRAMLENAIAALDNATYSLTFPSGCAALTTILQNYTKGDHIMCAHETFGGTRATLLHYTELHGIGIDFVDMASLESIRQAIRPNTKVSRGEKCCLSLSTAIYLPKTFRFFFKSKYNLH